METQMRIAMRRITRRGLVAAGCLWGLAVAAQTYPTRPVTLIVPFPPGGGTDVAARLFAKELGDRLGQSVVVDNRAGAAGNLGTGVFVRAAADGYTLLFTAQSPVTIADSISPKLPYSPTRDLVPIALTQLTPVLVVVPANLPVKSLAELAKVSRANPSSLFFGSPGTGNELHLAGEWLKREARMDITHVPYKGSGPALQDLLAGRIQMLVASPASVSQHIADGRLRAIATLSTQRLAGFPDVPTAAESGYPQLVYDAWFGLFAPKNTPAPVVKRLEQEAAAIASVPGYRRQLSDLGVLASGDGAQAFAGTIGKNRAVWSDLVKSLHLTEDIYK
ncbi:tripartite tricarboxylate transporter substrate binding protein [Pseudorhodoferax sp. Leaf265]|uniref:Bug family tripartite tricarboxylate transporter substrate binding protein n=1 Tax=Pseudorhodoferax sp. Leaf265 TaxID=1736315 RepID=UPI0007C8162D|nr:tripartite tricarboxylate transporter substrate binding protein [Pseudorhodoferax sp. Leaf265]